MSNAVVGSDEGAVRRQHEEEGDGLHQATENDPSSRKYFEADPPAAHQNSFISEKAMEGGHVDEAHRAQGGDGNTESMMQEGYGDRERMAQHGDTKAEKILNEGFDDELHRDQHGYSSSDEELQAGYGGRLHRAQSWNPSCEQSGHGDEGGEAKLNYEYAPSIASKSPQAQKATNAENPHNSSVSANLTNIGALSEHGELSAQANLASCRTSGEHRPEDVTSAQDSHDNADENLGGQGRPLEYSSAAYMTPFGTSGEHTHKAGFTNGTVGERVLENTSTSGSPDQHSGEHVDLHTEGWQPGKYLYKSMPGNGSAGDNAPGYARDEPFKHADFWGNVYDHTSRNNEFDTNAHEKNTELLLRFGSAVFSLIAFSVIISTNEKRVAAGSTFYVKFSDYQAYNYLAALNLLSFLYSGGQLVLLAQAKRNNILSSPVKSGIFLYLCDQILAILMVSSSSSAATASELSRHGLHNIWPPACSTWQLLLFCTQADVAVSISFISFLFMFLSSFSSGYRLSKLLAE